MDDWLESSLRSAQTTKNSVSRNAGKPSKDSIQKGLAIQQRLREQRLTQEAERAKQAEKNREAFPWTTGCLSTIRSRFEGAAVLGFTESGVSRGTPDVFSNAIPVAAPYVAKAPRPPRGLSVNKGRKEEQFDD